MFYLKTALAEIPIVFNDTIFQADDPSLFLYLDETELFLFHEKTCTTLFIYSFFFFSPYIPAECLVMTDNGTVYLWNADKG